jgi:hypothetical protein
MATTTKLVETEVVVDDFTGQELGNYGWELTGRNNSVTLQFHSLSSLLAALATRGDLFGVSDDHLLQAAARRFPEFEALLKPLPPRDW